MLDTSALLTPTNVWQITDCWLLEILALQELPVLAWNAVASMSSSGEQLLAFMNLGHSLCNLGHYPAKCA